MSLNINSIRCLTFDLDDTLWPLHKTIQRAEESAFSYISSYAKDFAHAFHPSDLARFRKDIVREEPSLKHKLTELRRLVYLRALLDAGANEEQGEVLANAALAAFRQARNEVVLYPGVDETLSKLADRYVIGAITNGNVSFSELPVSRHFSFYVCAEDVGISKPAEPIFSAAFDHCVSQCDNSLDPKDILHIGDNLSTDVGGANNFGFMSCWLKHEDTNQPKETDEKVVDKPHLTISSLCELEALLLA